MYILIYKNCEYRDNEKNKVIQCVPLTSSAFIISIRLDPFCEFFLLRPVVLRYVRGILMMKYYILCSSSSLNIHYSSFDKHPPIVLSHLTWLGYSNILKEISNADIFNGKSYSVLAMAHTYVTCTFDHSECQLHSNFKLHLFQNGAAAKRKKYTHIHPSTENGKFQNSRSRMESKLIFILMSGRKRKKSELTQ